MRRDELPRDGSGRIERRADDPRLGRHGALRHRARRLTAPRDGSPLPTASACSPTSRTIGTYARGESRAAREDSGRILPGAVLLRRPRNVVLRAWRHPGLHGARPAGHPRLRPAGTYPATIVTATTASVAASTVAGSYGLSTISCAPSSRPAASAIGMPTATPVTTVASVSRRIMRWMAPPLAPSGMRTPISR